MIGDGSCLKSGLNIEAAVKPQPHVMMNGCLTHQLNSIVMMSCLIQSKIFLVKHNLFEHVCRTTLTSKVFSIFIYPS